ncbi:hypothetical protein PHLGIDRAFT_63045 [Phlebiopsis gigantea 11061_1 CR5-6]|uniref:FAD-binding PCMH-type domain-containing protein n=1 Tax=Phlebiopsis gigantea (strain 11061_1 CR5-6) TaxID=745531 RepID=A0A0C3P207_PHLG1|nr:hypothetical protein PHLGIDRAFT_63045 [Phlebiopsis gigantea 11061_1 CR5-6]
MFRLFVLISAVSAPLALQPAAALSTSTAPAVSWNDWVSLNASVGGRLHVSGPLALPCFSSFAGHPTHPDPPECAAIQHNYTDPLFRSAHFGAFMNPQWEICQTTDAGCVLDSADPTDPSAFTGVDCELGNIAPAYIDVQAVKDIQAAYTFSRKTGVRLSVKNKGHDYKGRSAGRNSLSLWMVFDAHFQPETCNTSYRAITIGTGVRMEQLYQFADANNVTAIGGYHRTIGTGYFLVRGHSILSPVYGLAVDRTVEIKIVTPDGQYRTANECQNSNLFWALRGGGGSAFGVVTEITVRVEPRLTLQAAIIRLPANASLDTLAAWYELTVNNSLRWGEQGWGGHITAASIIHVNPLLNNSAAQSSMQVAIDFATSHGGSGLVDELPSWYAFFEKYVTSAEAPVGAELMLGTRLLNTSLFATEAGRASLSTAITNLLPFATPYIIVGTPLLYPYVEGTTSVTPAWRSALWHFGFPIEFAFNDTAGARQTIYQEVTQHVQVFRDLTPGSGAYFNEGDVYEPNHEQAYWGPNYARLLQIKDTYDPDHLMDCWQCGTSGTYLVANHGSS